MCAGVYVEYPLCLRDFNEICIFSTDFCKILKCQISWKSVSGSQFVSCGLTDTTTQAVAFHNFVYALTTYHSSSSHKLLTFPGNERFPTFCINLLHEDKRTFVARTCACYIFVYLCLILWYLLVEKFLFCSDLNFSSSRILWTSPQGRLYQQC
jgi:hypothetical protein